MKTQDQTQPPMLKDGTPSADRELAKQAPAQWAMDAADEVCTRLGVGLHDKQMREIVALKIARNAQRAPVNEQKLREAAERVVDCTLNPGTRPGWVEVNHDAWKELDAALATPPSASRDELVEALKLMRRSSNPPHECAAQWCHEDYQAAISEVDEVLERCAKHQKGEM